MKYCVNSVDISKAEIQVLGPEVINTKGLHASRLTCIQRRIPETLAIGRDAIDDDVKLDPNPAAQDSSSAHHQAPRDRLFVMG
jgi:hypothetical protein